MDIYIIRSCQNIFYVVLSQQIPPSFEKTVWTLFPFNTRGAVPVRQARMNMRHQTAQARTIISTLLCADTKYTIFWNRDM